MKNNFYKKSLSLISIFIVTAFISFAAFSGFFASAQESETVPTSVDETAGINVCKDRLIGQIKELRTEYGNYITEHFQEDLPTSILVDLGVKRYAKYREDIMAAYEDFSNLSQVDIKDFNKQLLSAPDCFKVIPEELFAAQEVLKAHIIGNANAKQTTRLVTAYKALNTRLEKLYFDTAQIYGYFSTFADRTPCYPTNCVTQ